MNEPHSIAGQFLAALAAIQAEPMSRRIVVRYGFQEYARTHIYAWMPVMDMAIIRSLVPDE